LDILYFPTRRSSDLASGDDYFLLKKVSSKYPDGVGYLKNKEAIVSSKAAETIEAFLQQRIRWSSKSGKNNDLNLTFSLLVVYVFNVLLIAYIICALVMRNGWEQVCLLLMMKITVESILFVPVATFFGKQRQIWALWILQPFHSLYILLAGFFGFLGKYNWKNRDLK